MTRARNNINIYIRRNYRENWKTAEKEKAVSKARNSGNHCDVSTNKFPQQERRVEPGGDPPGKETERKTDGHDTAQGNFSGWRMEKSNEHERGKEREKGATKNCKGTSRSCNLSHNRGAELR